MLSNNSLVLVQQDLSEWIIYIVLLCHVVNKLLFAFCKENGCYLDVNLKIQILYEK